MSKIVRRHEEAKHIASEDRSTRRFTVTVLTSNVKINEWVFELHRFDQPPGGFTLFTGCVPRDPAEPFQ
jgi:hypothetical protein